MKSSSRSGLDQAGMAAPVWHWWIYLLLLLLPSLVLAASFKHVNHAHWSSGYDRLFKKYSKHYFGVGFNWRWFKAQGIAESGLQADARSSSGARGVMQIVPSTFSEIQQANPAYVDIDDPQWNIAAAIYYDRKLYRRWQKRLPKSEWLKFTFASYNAGFSRVLRAQKKSGGEQLASKWDGVAPFVPLETRNYVKRIRRLMQNAQGRRSG